MQLSGSRPPPPVRARKYYRYHCTICKKIIPLESDLCIIHALLSHIELVPPGEGKVLNFMEEQFHVVTTDHVDVTYRVHGCIGLVFSEMDTSQVDYAASNSVPEDHNVVIHNNGSSGGSVAATIGPVRRAPVGKSNDQNQAVSSQPHSVRNAQSQNSVLTQDMSFSAETTIRELEANESSSITGVLRYCKQRILQPYLKLLGIIGLKHVCNDSTDLCTCSILINKIYVVLVTILLMSGYVLQYLTCYRRDRGFAYKDWLLNATVPHKHNATIEYEARDAEILMFSNTCKGNSVYVHLFPSLLHFGSYLYVVYLYRISPDEQLPNLLERVFIHAAQTHLTHFSQKKLVRGLQVLVLISIGWVFLSLSNQIIQISLHDIYFLYWKNISHLWKYGLLSFMTVSSFWQDIIQVAVIASYCIHCSLLTTYLALIESRIQHHSLTLGDCMKEIGEIDKLVSYVNTHLGPALLPLVLLDAIYTISSVAFILDKGFSLEYLDLATVAFSGILWLLLLLFPLFKAARLSTACNQLRSLGHFCRMRPFGYQTTSQTDLDSFLIFVATLRMNVHIIRIPINATVISLGLASICFGLLTWGLFFV